MIIGAIQLARQITESNIWTNKPAWWFKVWCFLLMHVNHASNKSFDRGHNFFSYSYIYDECRLVNDGVKKATIDNVIRWLRQSKMITTQKTTRGIIISICNYDTYQDLINYKNDTSNEIKTRHKRDTNETINKNVKNVKNVKKEDIGEFGQALSDFRDMRKSIKKPLTERAEEMIITKLEKLSDNESERIDILNQSTMSSYLGVFPLKRDFVKEEEKPIFREPTNFVGYGK